jgi:uncharacterized membrane protein HdeD (DUF308 family)
MRDIITFCTGVTVLLWQTVLESQAQSVLVGAALVLMGVLPVSAILRRNGQG